MGKHVIDWIGLVVVLRALLGALCLSLVRWALTQFAAGSNGRGRATGRRVRRRGWRGEQAAGDAASLDRTTT